MVTTSSRCCRRLPPSSGSSSACLQVHEEGNDPEAEASVGSRVLVSQATRLVTWVGDTPSQRVSEEGEEVTEIRDPKSKRVQDRRTPAQRQADRLVQQGLAPSTNAPKLRDRAVGKQARAALPPYASKAQSQAARTKRAQAMPPYVNPGVTRAAGRAATKQRMGAIPPYANPAVIAAVTRKRANAMPPYASPAQSKVGGGRITGSSKKGKK